MGELVQLLLKSNAANSLVEDYAACLELWSEESQIIESSNDDPGILIMQVSLIPLDFCLDVVLNLCKLLFLSVVYMFAASD